ncbi:MAG: response regulator, partial [Verrucomicrobia bacterium]|nr:response regulator [Verrucomicrobiota bacterium]
SAVQSAVRSHLDQARLRLLAAQQTTSPTELTGLLGQFYIAIHAFHLEAERAELRNVTHLASALEGMLKKMLEATKRSTPSTLGAATAALDLMEELCVQPESGRQPDLRGTPARILVVDDDPVARRAVSTAVQLAFGRPDNAESGEVALGLVAEKPYDLIFLDVLMPGIDGFVTCSRIHETALNRRTPVVFVTSHDDADARSKAVTAGGCGFIPKPVLASQIKLTALTFIMRARLNESRMVSEPVAEACVQTA